jgi:copper transport protein
VYWRAISVDGHPVRGVFTFAVGPNEGPQPQFRIPSTSETAATPRLVTARWVVFLSLMAAIGLFVLRIAIARPVIGRVRGSTLRAVTIAFAVATTVALVATPVYLLMATAEFALRSTFDVGTLLPLVRKSAFGRAYADLELCLALFAVAAGLAIRIDRPERPQRSLAELFGVTGAFAAAAAVIAVVGASGHAAQTSPAAAALTFDWIHVTAGALWVGGLAGLLVLWRSLPEARRVAGLVVTVPRFSNVAFVSVLALVASGIAASILHLPTLASLWQTSYGKAIVVKVVILAAAILLAAVNLVSSRPRLQAHRRRPELAPGAAKLLRRLVAGEVLLVAGAVLAAAVLTSLPPPAKALAKTSGAVAHVGPGRVARTVNRSGYRLDFVVEPNKAAAPNDFSVRITRGGKPVRGAVVTTNFAMLDMEMGEQSYRLQETAPGVYMRTTPALVMVGHWGLTYTIVPPGHAPISVLFVDRAAG